MDCRVIFILNKNTNKQDNCTLFVDVHDEIFRRVSALYFADNDAFLSSPLSNVFVV